MSQSGIIAESGGVTLPVAINNGGHGQITKTEGFDALAPTTTKGDIIVNNGTDNIRVEVGADTTVLTADSSELSGVKFAAAGGGSAFPTLNNDATNNIYCLGYPSGVSNSTLSVTNQELMFIAISPGTTFTITGLAIHVSTAVVGSTARFGIYGDSSGLPGSLLADSGSVDIGTTGVKNGTISLEINSGSVYYLACVIDENGGSVSIKAGGNAPITRLSATDFSTKYFGYHQTGVSVGSSLPATATPVLWTQSNVPFIAYKIN